MSRIVRRVRQPGVYFVTTDTWQRREVFKKPAWAKILEEQILSCRDRGMYKLHAFVIMPDHLHVLLTPGESTTLEKAMQMIKGGSAHRIGKELGSRFPVWQVGFHDRWARNEKEYRAMIQYIEQNPVEAGICSSERDYPWGSAAGGFALDKSKYDKSEVRG